MNCAILQFELHNLRKTVILPSEVPHSIFGPGNWIGMVGNCLCHHEILSKLHTANGHQAFFNFVCSDSCSTPYNTSIRVPEYDLG